MLFRSARVGGQRATIFGDLGDDLVIGGAADDTINVGSLAPATGGNVNSLAALLTVNGQAGSGDVLNVDVSAKGERLGTMRPEKRVYFASRQPTSEVSIRRRLNEDLYLNFAGAANDNEGSVIQAYVFPLVSWIWIGFWMLVSGTLICLVPSKTRVRPARPSVKGTAGEYAAVQN